MKSKEFEMNHAHLRTVFSKLDADISVTHALVDLYRDNQRNHFADPIKFWVMTADCLDKLRKETEADLYINLRDRDTETWKFMEIPIAVIASRNKVMISFVEAVF